MILSKDFLQAGCFYEIFRRKNQKKIKRKRRKNQNRRLQGQTIMMKTNGSIQKTLKNRPQNPGWESTQE